MKMINSKEAFFSRPAVVCITALICCALWGSAIPGIKIGYELFQIQGYGSQILFAGYRFFLAGIITLVFASIGEKKPVTIKPSSVPAVFGQGLLQTTIQYVFFYVGLSYTTGTKAALINGSNAFFSIFFAHFLIKGERITIRKTIGCIVGFLGVILVNMTPGGFDLNFRFIGEGFVLLCAVANSLSAVTIKYISRVESPTAITAYQLLFGGACLVGFGLILGGTVHCTQPSAIILLIYLAVVSSLAFSLWAIILKYNSVSRISVYNFCIPLFGVTFSAIFLAENIFTLQNLGAIVLVSAGILIVNREQHT